MFDPEMFDVEFTRGLVKLATANNGTMDGTTAPVMKMVAGSEVVIGIWQDAEQPLGVGKLIVKGANHLREIAASGDAKATSITAITCVCREQAEALRQYVGADLTH